MDTISTQARKLNGCVKQLENLNPSGASEKDILDRAKVLFMQDPNFEKFKDNVPTARHAAPKKRQVNYDSSQSDSHPPSPISSSPGLSSSFNKEVDTDSGSDFSTRPIGVKKAKLKKKNDEDTTILLKSVKSDNEQLIDMLKKSSLDRQEQLQIQRQNMAYKEQKREDKIMFMDLNSIHDPQTRAYIMAERSRILQKKSQEGGSSAGFGNLFDGLGGSGSGLNDY
ncbi:unnamed protein product [Cuscuta epithymum]|uniref:No apical meristem-associated C-terminal domain-containing protein n=1 Tax=Cuscuta epithymum TaxID=186058 RepID=A0AAV0EUQ7_9ASTE|nr:unnamed protein product [Cuscuta epithymum]